MEKVYDIYCLRQPYLSGRGDPHPYKSGEWSWGLGYGGGNEGREATAHGGGSGHGKGDGDGECYGSFYGDGRVHEGGFFITHEGGFFITSGIGKWQDSVLF